MSKDTALKGGREGTLVGIEEKEILCLDVVRLGFRVPFIGAREPLYNSFASKNSLNKYR